MDCQGAKRGREVDVRSMQGSPKKSREEKIDLQQATAETVVKIVKK